MSFQFQCVCVAFKDVCSYLQLSVLLRKGLMANYYHMMLITRSRVFLFNALFVIHGKPLQLHSLNSLTVNL